MMLFILVFKLLVVGLFIRKFCLFSERKWKFLPSKFVRPPNEFLIYGNVMRQTVLDNFFKIKKN